MKTKEQIRRIRQSKRFVERLLVAEGAIVYGKYQREILAADTYDPRADLYDPNFDGDEEARELNKTWRSFQRSILEAIKKRNSEFFRDLARAIDYRKADKRETTKDKRRSEMLWYWALSGKNATAKQIGEHLRNRGLSTADEDVEHFIRREFKIWGMPLKSAKVGTPRKEQRQERRKKVR